MKAVAILVLLHMTLASKKKLLIATFDLSPELESLEISHVGHMKNKLFYK